MAHKYLRLISFEIIIIISYFLIVRLIVGVSGASSNREHRMYFENGPVEPG